MKRSPYFSQEHEEFRQMVRKFAEEKVRPVAAELDQKEIFSEELTKAMGYAGLFGVNIPKKYGGLGRDYSSLVLAVEEIARVDGSQAATLAAHNSLGIGPIYMFGTEEQKQKFIPQLTSGEHTWAFALTEPNAGSDAMGAETFAEIKNGEWVINGNKIFISNAAAPMSLGGTILAVTGEEDGKKLLTCILVESSSPGYGKERITNKMMWRSADTGKLSFDNVKVPESNLLGELGKGGRQMLETLDSGRLTIGAMGLGLARGAFEMAMEYANKRQQFGKSIKKFQAVSFKLADMALKIELAANTLYNAVWRKDNGLPFGKEAAMAKLYTSEIAREVADEAVQIHGAYGLVRDNDVERFYRDQRILQIGEGTSEILRLVISRHIDQ
ncbi:MAG: acyl-CoA dehydrogenase [Bacteroidetes bacterium]|nr:MAG: acyl-CoA dehydrogenase [Bacteroidota bacterium]